MAKAGMNPAKLKYIMGHSSMEITFDTYTHLQVDDVKEEMYVMMQKENELMHQEEIVEQLASEEELLVSLSKRQGAKRSNLHLFLHLLSVKI